MHPGTDKRFEEEQFSRNLADYTIVSPLGRGAGSFVYKIKCRKTQREAALKVIDKRQASYATVENRIKNEIRIHSNLDHKNIVKMLSFFEDSDNHYICIEICEGGELFGYLKTKSRLSEAEARALGYQLAQGIKYLHDHKIVHRDLKLGNILLTKENKLKICDFGLAVQLNENSEECLTLCGTPNYISPEILQNQPYGMKIDCWSFGCILYAMVTGNPPFESETVQQTLERVKNGIVELPNYLSSRLRSLLQGIFTIDSEKRFTIEEILSDEFFKEEISRQMTPVDMKRKAVIRKQFSIQELESCKENLDNTNTPNPSGNSLKYSLLTSIRTTASKEIRYQGKALSERPRDFNNISKQKEIKCESVERPQMQMVRSPSVGRMNPSGNQSILSKMIRSPSAGKIQTYENQNIVVYNEGIRKNETENLISKHKSKSKSIDMTASKTKASNSSQKIDLAKSPQIIDISAIKSPTAINLINSKDNSSLGKSSECSLFCFSELKTDNKLGNQPTVYTDVKKNLFPITEKEEKSVVKTRFTTFCLNTMEFQTKKGPIKIKSNGMFEMELGGGKLLFSISEDGYSICLWRLPERKTKKEYDIYSLPIKYAEFYNYATVVVDKLKSRIPCNTAEKSYGIFKLYRNSGQLSFEAIINKLTIYHKVSSPVFSIMREGQAAQKINIYEDLKRTGPGVSELVTTCMRELSEMLAAKKGSELVTTKMR